MESKRFRTAHQWYVAGNPGYGTTTFYEDKRTVAPEDAPMVRTAGVAPQKTKWPLILALLVVGGFLFFAGPVGALRMRPLG
jgi:hypothetical protein